MQGRSVEREEKEEENGTGKNLRSGREKTIAVEGKSELREEGDEKDDNENEKIRKRRTGIEENNEKKKTEENYSKPRGKKNQNKNKVKSTERFGEENEEKRHWKESKGGKN